VLRVTYIHTWYPRKYLGTSVTHSLGTSAGHRAGEVEPGMDSGKNAPVRGTPHAMFGTCFQCRSWRGVSSPIWENAFRWGRRVDERGRDLRPQFGRELLSWSLERKKESVGVVAGYLLEGYFMPGG
jgi:hypothetical protein